jgi:alkyldihydroxyacetonephosphate synthase
MGLAIIETLTAAIGATKVRTDDATLQERRHDYWVLSYLDDMQGRPAPKPACVVQPESVGDVVAVVNACRENGVALIPFGLGSGACGGIIGHPDKVLLDMSTMNRTRYISDNNLLASFEAGKNGGEAHHHGIGRLRKNYLPLDLGDGGTGLLRTLKQALDPTGFMNPGVLIPDA